MTYLVKFDSMRERLNIDKEVSRLEALAEGVARGDEEAVMLAQKARFLDRPGAAATPPARS
jgi:hypothetical protein